MFNSIKQQYIWNKIESSFYSSSAHGHGVAGAWEAQYALSARISIYGDIGVRYIRNTTSQSVQKGVAPEISWGLILYLR